jgi:hydroxypyruvate reductase
MAGAAVSALAERGRAPALGIVVVPTRIAPPHPALGVAVGDHPIPGASSLAAADAVQAVVRAVEPHDGVILLLSGGASSLAAAPVEGVAAADLHALFALLHGAGLDIRRMNLVRKRVARWGAGRLAAALAPARVLPIVLSDVPGDAVEVIGSGPCAPDDATAREVRALLDESSLLERVPPSILAYLDAAERDPRRETPKPGDARLAGVLETELLGHRAAVNAAAADARARGLAAIVSPAPLDGEAAVQGARLAEETLRLARQLRTVAGAAATPLVTLHGGETTVTLPADGVGLGGRSQELALAAARVLAGARGDGPSRARDDVAMLAAGTDGRDGPTDAAGAVVDASTWRRARDAGRDPELDLSRHDSYRALDAAGALLRTGLTGTNVMDVAIALVDVPPPR